MSHLSPLLQGESREVSRRTHEVILRRAKVSGGHQLYKGTEDSSDGCRGVEGGLKDIAGGSLEPSIGIDGEEFGRGREKGRAWYGDEQVGGNRVGLGSES